MLHSGWVAAIHDKRHWDIPLTLGDNETPNCVFSLFGLQIQVAQAAVLLD
jgi:hypothetical protein